MNMYTSGFPCQPFSNQGLRPGQADPLGRGLIIHWVINTIRVLRPFGFILENVRNLATAPSFADFFAWLISELRTAGYYIETAVLGSLHYGAVPAARKRRYVIGIRRDRRCQPWTWPAPLPLVPLSAVLEQGLPRHPASSLNLTQLRNLSSGMVAIERKDLAVQWSTTPWVMDLETSKSFGTSISYNRLPTITKTRARTGLWLNRHERFTSTTELLRCQGIDPNFITLPETVSEKQLRAMIGNSFSLGVSGLTCAPVEDGGPCQPQRSFRHAASALSCFRHCMCRCQLIHTASASGVFDVRDKRRSGIGISNRNSNTSAMIRQQQGQRVCTHARTAFSFGKAKCPCQTGRPSDQMCLQH